MQSFGAVYVCIMLMVCCTELGLYFVQLLYHVLYQGLDELKQWFAKIEWPPSPQCQCEIEWTPSPICQCEIKWHPYGMNKKAIL